MSRALFILGLILAAFNGFSQEDNDIDILHYTFNIVVNDSNDSISCSAVIQFNYVHPSDKIWFDLISLKGNGKGMKVMGVWDEENRQPLNFTHGNDLVRINTTGTQSGTQSVRIDYKGIPADGLIIGRNKFNHRTFFADNWPNRGRNWLVCKDHPSDKASVDFVVTAPVHYQVVSNGIQVEETNLPHDLKLTHWRETADLPVKVMAIGVAEFAVNFEGYGESIPVYSWVFPENRDIGFNDYAAATKILPFFIDYIGPFPYKKLANVQSKTVFGGMENAGAIFYAENSVTGNQRAGGLISHEIAHQWFGDMVTEKSWAEVWLSEGFATYFSLRYLEAAYGEDTLHRQLEENRKKVIAFSRKHSGPVVDSTIVNYIELLNANAYEKGGWILYMLNKQIGESAFHQGIRNYYADFSGKNATTADFQKEMEKASGKDLQHFFHQWLYVGGQPALKMVHSYAAGTLTVRISQMTDYLYEFPLTVRIRNKETEVTKSIRLSGKETIFKVPMDSGPDEVILDPNGNLLFEELK